VYVCNCESAYIYTYTGTPSFLASKFFSQHLHMDIHGLAVTYICMHTYLYLQIYMCMCATVNMYINIYICIRKPSFFASKASSQHLYTDYQESDILSIYLSIYWYE